MGPGTRKLFMLAILTLAVSTSISGVNAYFSVHTICKGWTESEEPILADRFLVGDPVYLYFRISWEEPEMPRGWSPERSGPITVTEPEGPELWMWRLDPFVNVENIVV